METKEAHPLWKIDSARLSCELENTSKRVAVTVDWVDEIESPRPLDVHAGYK